MSAEKASSRRNDNSDTAIVFLAVRGSDGRRTKPLPAARALALFESIKKTSAPDGFIAVPEVALHEAGCDILAWDRAVEANSGGVLRNGVLFLVSIDNGPTILETLSKWKDPKWHLLHAEGLAAAQIKREL